MKKVRMSNGEYATCIEDFEDVIGSDNLNAINELINYNDEFMMSVYDMIEEMKDYITESKRMNKQKMLSMLDDMVNQFENY